MIPDLTGKNKGSAPHGGALFLCLHVARYGLSQMKRFSFLVDLMAKVFTILLGLIFIAGGLGHFFIPDVYRPFFPDWVPYPDLVIYASGVVEVLVGVAMFIFIPQYRKWGALGILILLILFLPLHIRDLFLDEPVLKETAIVIARIPIQLIMIWMAWVAYKKA